jgi:hypothetical protein
MVVEAALDLALGAGIFSGMCLVRAVMVERRAPQDDTGRAGSSFRNRGGRHRGDRIDHPAAEKAPEAEGETGRPRFGARILMT